MTYRLIGWVLIGFTVALGGCTVTEAKDDDGKEDAGAAGSMGVAGGETGTGGDTGTGGAGDPDASAGGARNGAPIGLGAAADGGPGGAGGGGAAPSEGPNLDDPSRAAARAIQEADIIQVRGTKLYAMSAAGGLSVIDVSVRDKLTLLGRYRTDARPFEMYVRGDTLFALFNDACVWADDLPVGKVGRAVALNVADPTKITEIASFDLPGEISDSRVVGDILYVVAYKNGICYDCGTVPETTVISLNIKDPTAVTEIDKERFEETSGDTSATRSTVTVTDQRMYVSSVQEAQERSTIQVVDISDPAGQMELGGTVDVKGAIFSRWQMDEYLNVLRVISQPPSWNTLPPVVETFTIAGTGASTNFTKLGELTLTNVPDREQLRSVRFDGTKAYAITFRNTDPLFTIDLTDPAVPTQPGQLEMPGWIYHMEPRGDRMLALGFDTTSSEGGLNVTLINTADLANPTQMQRVEFGGTWSPKIEEDQDRVHKLFNILDDIGLILVPYSGFTDDEGCGSFGSGIQLISFTRDTLTEQGIAPAIGTARRAFLYDERLFSVSTDRVQVFDIADLNAPTQTASLGLATRVHRTVPVGDKVLRIQSDYDTRVSMADLVPLTDVEGAASGTPLNLVKAIYDNADTTACYYYNDLPFKTAPAFAFGTNVAIAVTHYDNTSYEQVTDVLVLDTSGAQPTVLSKTRLDVEPGAPELGETVAKVGNVLVVQGDTATSWDDSDITPKLAGLDLTDPASPKVLTTLSRPNAWGATGIFGTGSQTANGYYVADDELGVRYLLDRVDWTATGGTAQTPIDMPGLLLGPLGSRFLSVDFQWAQGASDDSWACELEGGEFDWESSICWISDRAFQMFEVGANGASVVSKTVPMDRTLRLAAVRHSDTRYFLPAVSYDNGSYGQARERVLVIGPDAQDQLTLRTVALARTPVSSTAVAEKLYFINGQALGMIDATDVAGAKYTRLSQLFSEEGVHLSISGKTALVSLGDAGVQAITLP